MRTVARGLNLERVLISLTLRINNLDETIIRHFVMKVAPTGPTCPATYRVPAYTVLGTPGVRCSPHLNPWYLRYPDGTTSPADTSHLRPTGG